MKSNFRRNKYLKMGLIGLLGLLMMSISACGDDDAAPVASDPTTPWTVTATAAPWLSTNPIADKHDGGWTYSAREDRLYAMYGNDNSGQTLYRIDPIGETSTIATTFLFGRHGAHPVIDNTGTNIYMPPSQSNAELERYNTVTSALEALAPAPATGTFSHGAWKNSKLWIVLDDNNLYSYDPTTDVWSAPLHDFGARGNVATSGPGSNLIYVIAVPGNLYSYDVTTGTTTTLAAHPTGFDLGGNGQFTWFGGNVGFIYAVGGCSGTPAIYDIAGSTWHAMSDPKLNGNCNGHSTYDSSRKRLYVTDGSAEVWYYQF